MWLSAPCTGHCFTPFMVRWGPMRTGTATARAHAAELYVLEVNGGRRSHMTEACLVAQW